MVFKPLNILLVEDEESHAELTRYAFLKAEKTARIDIVGDGKTALDYLFNKGKYSDKERYPSPGLVLLDLTLPGIDGIEVLRRIKKDLVLKKIPVVIFTASEYPGDILKSYDNHANGYVTKVLGLKPFEEKIRQIYSYWMLINKAPL